MLKIVVTSMQGEKVPEKKINQKERQCQSLESDPESELTRKHRQKVAVPAFVASMTHSPVSDWLQAVL
jgi:hypothetical protein